MLKLIALAALAGLATAATALPSAAQFAAVPGGPNNPITHENSDCDDQLGFMPRVSRADIESINGQPVYLVPICEYGLIGRGNDYSWLFIDGNVDTLRLPLARNRTLMAALTAKGYDQHDVVSLFFGGGGSIYLYVHQRDMR